MEIRPLFFVLVYGCARHSDPSPDASSVREPAPAASDTPATPSPSAPPTTAPIAVPVIAAQQSHCADVYRSFIYTDAVTTWTTINVNPADGMAGIAAALSAASSDHAGEPVRLLLAPGTYATPNEDQGDFFIEDVARTAANPLLIEAQDKAPNATRVTQGFVLVNSSYIAFDGLSIGPDHIGTYSKPGECGGVHAAPHSLNAQAGIHVAGAAMNPMANGQPNGHIDWSVYGRFNPASHILVRRVTIQNIHSNDEPSGAEACGGGADGIKFNQAEDVVVIDSSIRQVSRHGIDNVGVHRGLFCNNTISDTGQGMGIEAKGGSVDIVYDANVFVNVRRVEIGGEMTDAAYYWSAETPGSEEHYTYEARRVVARNNIVIDPREAGFEFSGCHDCAITGNTVLYRAGAHGSGDVLREVDSAINADASAGSDCGEVANCWQVTAHPAELDGRLLRNARNAVYNNLFMTAQSRWGVSGSPLAPYDFYNPFNHPNTDHAYSLVGRADFNLWWNAGVAMTQDAGWLQEGSHTTYATGASPVAALDPNTTDPLLLRARILQALTPAPGIAAGSSGVEGFAAFDAALAPRPTPPSVGALQAR